MKKGRGQGHRVGPPKSQRHRSRIAIPEGLATAAYQLSGELGISREDALLELANRGAALYSQKLLERQLKNGSTERSNDGGWSRPALFEGESEVPGEGLEPPTRGL